jgi:Protein of unknown function (DUF3644)
MSRNLPNEVAIHLEKGKESAVAAVDCYNRSGTKFRSGSYIVLMCIAWTSVFHAIFFMRKQKPFYRNKQNPKRYQRVDGDYKAWELSGQTHLNLSKKPEQLFAYCIVPSRLESLLLDATCDRLVALEQGQNPAA